MEYHVGVTATRNGLTAAQQDGLERVLGGYMTAHPGRMVYLHHGDCVGGDEAADAVAHRMNARVIIHPPTNHSLRAFCKDAHFTLPQRPYLVRNRDIVESCDLLIGCPATESDPGHGGTWYTIRYGMSFGVNVITISPTGKIRLDPAMRRAQTTEAYEGI